MGSLGAQPPADGFGTCSLHRFTRALRCDLRRDPPEGEGCSRARGRGANSRTARGPPPVPLVRVASPGSGPSGHPSSRQTGAGSASMPTLWSVNHREPFSARHVSVWVPPVAGFPTGLIRVIGGQACNGLASSPRLGQQLSQVPSRLGSDRPHPSHRRAGLHGPCLTTATRTAVPSGS